MNEDFVQAQTALTQEILIVQPWIRLGGAELVSLHLAHELEGLGRPTAIVCAFLDLKGLPKWTEGLHYRLPPRWLAEAMRISRLLFLILSPWVLLALVWKQSRRVRLLNPHNFPATWVCSVVGGLRRIPVVWYCNEPPAPIPLRDILRVGVPDFIGWLVASSWLDRLFVRGIADVCVPSAMTRTQTEKRYQRHVDVLYVGIEADFYGADDGSDPRKAFDVVDKYVLLCVGKLHPQKNQLVCLEALREVIGDIPNVVLLLAGDGPSAPDLKSRVKQWGLQDRVRFLGHVGAPTVRQLYRACDINLVPAINLSWGFTAFEALCSGKVSVVSRSAGGAAEILDDNQIGLVCEPTGHAFAQAILRLHGDPDTYLEFSKKGREHVLRELTWRAFAHKALERFESQIGQNGSVKGRSR